MVDLWAMWIHQRTGENTAVSFRPGAVIFALFLIAGFAAQLKPLLIAAPIMYVLILVGQYSYPRLRARWENRAASPAPVPNQRELAKEYRRLVARERLENGDERPLGASSEPLDLEELGRLRQKYR